MAMTKVAGWVICLSGVIGLAVTWLNFSSNHSHDFGNSPIFLSFILIFSILPVYPLYRFARRWSSLRTGLIMVIGCLLLTLSLAVAHYLLRMEGPWIDGMLNVTECFFFFSCCVLVWQSARHERPK